MNNGGEMAQILGKIDIAAGLKSAINGGTVFESDSGIVAYCGNPRIHNAPVNPEDHGIMLLNAYAKIGPSMLESLSGSFAIAIVHYQLQKTAFAIDKMGIQPLSWARAGDTIIFGTSAKVVAQSATRDPGVNPQAIFDFMLNHMVPSPESVFTGVQKLLPGTCVEILGGKCRSVNYWTPDFERRADADLAAIKSRILPALRQSIADTVDNEPTGAFLSGGLDSSTVAGLLQQVTPEKTPAFSVGFGINEFDELSYAQIASRHFGLAHLTYEVTPADVVECIPLIAEAYDEPFGNSSAVPTLACARMASRHGITHLFAGDGGDELFGGNERYVRQRIFEKYQLIPNWIRLHLIEPVAFRFDPEHAPFLLRKFSSYVQQARISLPERFESWNLIYREDLSAVFSSPFLAAIDPSVPLARMTQVWESCPSSDLLDRMLWYDWKFILADNDLRKVNKMCEVAGVRVSYPMLDEAVISLSLAIPSEHKIRSGNLRSFFKDATRTFLPNEIIDKEKHGFGLPFGQWLKTYVPLQELVSRSLASLKERRIFDAEFLTRVESEHRVGDASYYGYAIWDLVMLEQWLQKHMPETAY